jgi:hypothetical protein
MDYVVYIAVDRDGWMYSRYGRDLQLLMFFEESRGRKIVFASSHEVCSEAKIQCAKLMRPTRTHKQRLLDSVSSEDAYVAGQFSRLVSDIQVRYLTADWSESKPRYYDDEEGPDSYGIGCPVKPVPPPRSHGYRALVPAA